MNMAKLVFFSLFFVITNEQSAFGMQDINYDKEQSELLIQECKKQEPSIENIKDFLVKKANPNNKALYLQDNYNRSPLGLICCQPNPSLPVIKLLIENKADSNFQDSYRRTPLFEIIKNKESNNLIDCVKILLKNEANPCIRNCAGYTSLHALACSNPSITIAILLLESQMNPIVKDIPLLLCNFCQKNTIFKEKLFTYMLCLKAMKLKVPKFVNFEIFKPLLKNLLVTTAICEFVTTKNGHNETASQEASNRAYQGKKFSKFASFLQEVGEKCKQGYEAYEEYINLFK